MPFLRSHSTRRCASLLVTLGLLASAFAQEPAAPPQTPAASADEEDEVVRVSSDLVQIDAVVLDREGRFVEGLKREDFEVTVDGQPQSLSFFEGVAAGSREEAAALARARGGRAARPERAAPAPGRGRTFLFFVDDLHLTPESLERTRKSLRRFIDDVMGPEDEAAVATATGQVGFLQQLTGNKAVLRAAVERIKRVTLSVRDGDRPTITEYLAYLVDRGDRDVLDALIEATAKETWVDKRTAEQIVRSRSRVLLQQSDTLNRNVLMSLMSLIRSAGQYPGRKLVYFFSDGFVPNFGDSHIDDMERRVADAAARSGVVIYTLDPQGLQAGVWSNASQPSMFDTRGRLTGALTREVTVTQEPLQTLAQATGGRALVNSNSLDEGLDRAEQETARYYLLAWRPEGAGGRDKAFRKLQVKVAGRPELKVLVRSGFFATPPADETEREAKPAKNAKDGKAAKPDDALLGALASMTARAAVPVMLSAGYERGQGGRTVLTASVEVDETVLDYGPAASPQPASAEVAGVVYDTTGKSAGGFRQRLTVPPPGPGSPDRRITFSNDLPLAPGLYQMRVAVRDARSGKVGSAMEWVEVPDLKPGAFSMSSLFLAERAAGDAAGELVISPDRRFARTSRLRLMAYVYDAPRAGATPPDVSVKVEVLRGDRQAVAPSESRLAADKAPNPARLTYAADINLGPLGSGRYVLQVTATDRASGSSVTRRADFVVL